MQLRYFRPVDEYIRSAFAVNLVRYHGVLAPHAKLRSAVVPKKPDKDELAKTRGKSKNRLLWAALLA